MYKNSSIFSVSCFRSRVLASIMLTILLCSFAPSVSLAQQPTATISALSGTVLVNEQAMGEGTVLNAGDVIETQAGASVVLELSDGSQLELGENTKLDIIELSQTATGARVSRVKMAWGWIRAKLSPGHQQAGSVFDIETPNALVGVEFSQPDVEISYDPAKQETVALARTVALLAKNLLTKEEVIVPVGSTVIITTTTIKIIAGFVSIGKAGAEAAKAEAVGVETATGIGGMSTKTMVIIGAGALVAAGGVAAIAAGGGGDGSDGGNGDGSDGESSYSVTGIFMAEDTIIDETGSIYAECKYAFSLVQTGNSVEGTHDYECVRFLVWSDGPYTCTITAPAPVTGTVNGNSVALSAPSVESTMVCPAHPEFNDSSMNVATNYYATIVEGGRILRFQPHGYFYNRGPDFIRQ